MSEPNTAFGVVDESPLDWSASGLQSPETTIPIPDSSGIARIVEMIDDPDVPLSDTTRFIALEIAGIMKLMTEPDPLARGSVSQRDLNDRIKAYRELQKTLMESDQLSKRDVLNLDGPKFRYVFTEVIGYFKEALKGAGVGPELAQNTMLQFGDLVKTRDESLRRELNRIDAGR